MMNRNAYGYQQQFNNSSSPTPRHEQMQNNFVHDNQQYSEYPHQNQRDNYRSNS